MLQPLNSDHDTAPPAEKPRSVHFSSASNEWSTPEAAYEQLNREFKFTLDPAATRENAKTAYYYTQESNGLIQPWAPHRVFCNPPYGRGLGKWVEKGALEARNGALVVMLLPARPDTKYWQKWILSPGTPPPVGPHPGFLWSRAQCPWVEIRWIAGRLKFGGVKNSAPFPSAVVIFWPFGGGLIER